MGDGVAGKEGAHDLGAFAEAGVAGGFVGPGLAADVFVEELAGAEGDPGEAAGEHLAEGGDGLGEEGRAVAPAAGDGDGAEGEALGAGHGGTEPRPGEAGVGLGFGPGVGVVGGEGTVEAGLLGAGDESEEVGGAELLLRAVIGEPGHGAPPMVRGCPSH